MRTAPATGDPLHIVLVEDEPAHAEAVRRAFQAPALDGEVDVVVVSTLGEYRRTVTERPPSLAIIDLNLPDGNAVDILTWPPEAGQCPVVVMTSYGSEQTAVDAMQAGALDYVVKSAETFAGMPRTVERALAKWHLLQERRRHTQLLEARLRLSEGAATWTLDELLRAICDEAERLTESQAAFLRFLDEDELTITVGAWSTKTVDSLCSLNARLRHHPTGEAGIWADAMRERRPIIHNDLASLAGRKGFPSGHAQIVRELVVPILSANRIVAVLGVGNKPQPYDQREVETLSALGVMAWDIVLREQAREERETLERGIPHAQKLESLGVLAGGIAHDFNNLLMAILGHAELALDDVVPDSPAGGSIREIIIASGHAADLCGQMLAYSGNAPFALEPVDLCELIDEMAQLLKTTTSKKATLALHLQQDVPQIMADPSQIRQVVMNLIMNASDAIEDQGGRIDVSVDAGLEGPSRLPTLEPPLDQPNTWVRMRVVDNGIGMDSTTLSRIFEPFFTTKFAGRGLGLAAVQGIVRGHHGAMDYRSEPGRGTVFEVYFPGAAPSHESSTTGTTASASAWRGSGTILLADDEAAVRAVTTRMLQRLGFTVLTANDGREAVEAYRASAGSIDLVILDLTMPNLDGIEAFAQLRAFDPGVRVVLASGYSQSDVNARVADSRLEGTLQKPYSLAKLSDLLSTLMPRSSADPGPPS